jgi:hypothetical protein
VQSLSGQSGQRGRLVQGLGEKTVMQPAWHTIDSVLA